MSEHGSSFPLSETSKVKDLIMYHPDLLRVLLDRGVPVSCAGGTIAEAARACGMRPQILLGHLEAALARSLADTPTEGAG